MSCGSCRACRSGRAVTRVLNKTRGGPLHTVTGCNGARLPYGKAGVLSLRRIVGDRPRGQLMLCSLFRPLEQQTHESEVQPHPIYDPIAAK
jgi:hypothetical protein